MKQFLKCAKHLIIGVGFLISSAKLPINVRSAECKDLRIIYARGSGAPRGENDDYKAFKSSIESKLTNSLLNYDFIDLDYPAVGVGLENIGVALGALFSGGENGDFGESVEKGAENLEKLINDGCTNTKYVIGGYSQGAIVVIKALKNINPDRIIYVATFGDPKIYLPEGEGIMPAACRGENLSPYRMYVPDCRAFKGLLGAYIPYIPDSFMNKVGTWCNKRDIFCSSKFSINDHVSYEDANLYEDAARVIYNKIADEFRIENRAISPHDTAFLIDATWSMDELIDKYKSEAFRLAKETLESGGRVALFAYHDLDDFIDSLVEYCNFDTCDSLETFKNKMDEIVTEYGGDVPESLLSASFHVMKNLNWKLGSTKSLVVLTDAGYHNPDRDGTTFDAVVKLSKEIDPVNFYIITNKETEKEYFDLASLTNGKVETDFKKLHLLTDYILERNDSLPRVEEGSISELPTLKITNTSFRETVDLSFDTNGERVLVIINDLIVGVTTEKNIRISDLDRRKENELLLVPINDDTRGDAVRIVVPEDGLGGTMDVIPKVPNTGGY